MKKTLSVLLMLALLVTSMMSLAVSAEEEFTEDGKPIAKAVYGTPVMDDAAEIDPLWDNVPEYTGSTVRPSVSTEDTGTTFTFKLMWDETHFYVYEKVYDLTIGSYDPSLHGHLNDSTEMAISLDDNRKGPHDPLTDGFLGYSPHENTYGGADIFGTDLENVEFAAYFDETGYVILSAFDVSAMNSNIAWGENHQLGFEISVNDSVEAGVRSTCIGWADETDNAYQDNTCLGVVYLVKNGDSDVPSGDASVDTDASAEAAESEEAAESTEATESTETTESEAASEATSEAVSEKAESEAPASSIADTSDSEGGFPIWIIIVIAAVVVVAVVVVVVMKKK